MGDFYAQLKRDQSKSIALYEASMELIHDGKHAYPIYWAPLPYLEFSPYGGRLNKIQQGEDNGKRTEAVQ